MKTKSSRPSTTQREAMPLLQKDETGANILMCPFCNPTHAILPFVPGPCGTTISITAKQTVYEGKYNKDMVCVKCNKTGGKMFLWNNAFVHIHDCAPGVQILMDPPVFSHLAKFTFNLKDNWLKKKIIKRYGNPTAVDEVTPEGNKTGKVLGYAFQRRTNAKHTETSASK